MLYISWVGTVFTMRKVIKIFVVAIQVGLWISVMSCLGFCNWQGSSADYQYRIVWGTAVGVVTRTVGVSEQWLFYVWLEAPRLALCCTVCWTCSPPDVRATSNVSLAENNAKTITIQCTAAFFLVQPVMLKHLWLRLCYLQVNLVAKGLILFSSKKLVSNYCNYI